jgi:hypothetical protein
VAIAVALGMVGCNRPTTTSLRAADVAGSWGRPGDAFPPVNLTLSDSAGALRARLQLSGTDARGSATLNGTRLRLTLDGHPNDITGEFVSTTELRLEFGSSARSYTLYRTTPPVASPRSADRATPGNGPRAPR